jgi:hypothetical protein
MSLVVRGSKTAMGPGLQASFLGSGGVEPYVYSVVPGGAGGSINSSTGLYTAPLVAPTDPRLSYATIKVTDADLDEATTTVYVADALGLFCEVIQREMGLADGRVYLWDQKISQPKDSGLFISVQFLNGKPFGNTNRPVSQGSAPGDGLDSFQSINMLATLQLSIQSRSTEALRRKEEVILALNSDYAQAQQEANSFYIGKLPAGSQFVSLSNIDGAAIPYRFDISVNVQYFYRKVTEVPYMSEFAPVEVTTEP